MKRTIKIASIISIMVVAVFVTAAVFAIRASQLRDYENHVERCRFMFLDIIHNTPHGDYNNLVDIYYNDCVVAQTTPSSVD
jgi:hypothetical protein